MDDPMNMLPPAWLPHVQAWAPRLLAALLLTTALVHLLLPIARAVERWALTTPATWDDGPARRAVEVLEWAAGLSQLLLALVPRLAVGRPGAPAKDAGPKPGGRPPPLPVLLALLVAVTSSVASGCGAGALGAQADLIAFGGLAAAEADEVLVGARARELDGVLERARAECSPGGCEEDRAEHHRAELARAEARWAPVLACRAPVVEALRSWLDGLETAHQAATSEVGLALLLRLGARFVAAYSALVACVEAAAPDVDLPGLPPALAGLAGGAR